MFQLPSISIWGRLLVEKVSAKDQRPNELNQQNPMKTGSCFWGMF